ncbi:hypothetical protein B0H13DRAFT_1855305 [Mycena leptocephala]|nr:hypothetical protein B0H13DRAFT_1855305 [Mycena leptocephala]
MYRVMLYCNLFSDSRFNLDELDSLDNETIQNIRCQCTAVLNGYLLDEILELNSPIHFLRGLLVKLVQDELTGICAGWTSSCLPALQVCRKPGKSAITTCSLKIWASTYSSTTTSSSQATSDTCLKKYARLARQKEDFLSKSEFRKYTTSESPPPKFSHEKLGVAIILAHFNTSSEAGGGV